MNLTSRTAVDTGAPEQLALIEGFPISGKGVELKKANGWTELVLADKQRVHFEGFAYVDGLATKRDKDESNRLIYKLSALELNISEA